MILDPIKIEGLQEFSRSLRSVDSDLPKTLRLAGNQAAEIVVGAARSRVVSRTGRAAGSLRASSTRTEARVSGGGKRAAYYPWLDFGGRVGRRASVHREFLSGGRYIYPAYAANREWVERVLLGALTDVVERAGMAVRGGK